MLQRILAVWMTYRTRKFLWPLALAYVVLLAGSFTIPQIKTPLWKSLFLHRDQSGLVFESFEDFSNWNPSDDKRRKLRSLVIYDTNNRPRQSPHPSAPSPQNTGERGNKQSGFTPRSKFTPHDIEKLSKCIGLRNLQLTSIDLSPELGEALANLPLLSELVLTMTESSSLDNLPPLQKLRTLTLKSPKPNELERLNRHSNLQLLKFTLDRIPLVRQTDEVDVTALSVGKVTQIEGLVVNHLNNALSDALIGEVAKLPNLRHISIDPPSPLIETKIRGVLAGRTPAVWVQPMTGGSPPRYLRLFSVASMILVLIVGLQLFSQVIPFWARTVPHFSTPHLFIVLPFVVLHITMGFLLFHYYGETHFAPALLTGLLTPTMVSLCSILAFRFKRSFLGILNLTPMVCVLSQMLFIPVQSMAGPTWMYSFMVGEHPLLALWVILVCLGIIAVGVYQWSRAAIVMAGHNVTYNGDYQAMARLLQSTRENEGTDSSKQQSHSRLDRDLEKLEKHKPPFNRVKRISRWNMGYRKDLSKIQSAFPFFAVLLTIAVVILVGGRLNGQAIDPWQVIAGLLFLGMLSAPVASIGIAIMTLQRRPLLGQELLRPVSRSVMSQWLFWSFGSQLWPAMIASIAFGIGLSQCNEWLDPEFSSTSYLALRIGLVCLVAIVASGTIAIFTLTLPCRWQRDFIGATLWLCLGSCLEFGFIGLVLQSDNPRFPMSPWLLVFAAFVSIVLGIIGILRLPHVEWGRD